MGLDRMRAALDDKDGPKIYAETLRQADRTTYVRSAVGDGAMTVWRLRDFVRALDAAGVPDNVKLEGHRTDAGHLNRLSARWTEEIDGWPERLVVPSAPGWMAPGVFEDADPGNPGMAEGMMSGMTQFISGEQLADWFAYHPPASPEIGEAHDAIRRAYGALAEGMNNLLPEGPDKTVALRAIREAMYHANACLAVAGKVYSE